MLCALISCVLAAGASSANAAFIQDTDFGTGGFAHLPLGVEDDELTDSLVQPDGKIVSCGRAELIPNPVVVVTRVNPDGSPDNTFSGDGRTYLGFGGNSSRCSGVEIDSTGRIYVGGQGSSGGVAQVARLDSTGHLTTSGYGTGGYASFDGGSEVLVLAIDLGPGDKIVGAGLDGGQFISSVYVGRLTAGGIADTGFFGTGSRSISYEAGEVNRANAVSVGSDNKITIAGQTDRDLTNPNVPHFVIGRFLANGNLDTGFGVNTGRTVFRVGIFQDQLYALQVQPDGGVIAAGNSFLASGGGGTSGVVVRVNSLGIPDTTFGTNGGFSLIANGGGASVLRGLTLDAAGRHVAVGYRIGGPVQLFRFNSTGVPDPDFAPNGILNLSSNLPEDSANAVATDAAGRLIATGSAENSEDIDGMIYVAKLAPPAADPLTPSATEPLAKITSPKAGKASKLTKISGSATGGTITRVALAIERVDSKQLKKKRCVFIKNTKRATKKVKVKSTKTCGLGVTINAKGTSSWSLKFSKSLPAGQYRITAIATASSGAKTATFSKSRGNQVLLRVKPKKR